MSITRPVNKAKVLSVVTEKNRELVTLLKAGGIKETAIAARLGLSLKELQENYAEELAFGTDHVNGLVVEALVKKALEGDVAAMKLWLSKRSKTFEEKQQLEVTVKAPTVYIPANGRD